MPTPKPATFKVKLVRSVRVRGKDGTEVHQAGSVHDYPYSFARELISVNKALPAGEEKKEKK